MVRAIHLFRLLSGVGAAGGLLLTAPAAHAAAAGRPQAVVPCSETALVNAVDGANAAGGGDLILAPFCTYTLTGAHSPGSSGGPAGLPNITTPISMTGLATDM
ncbi:hypothetical protein ACH4VT_10240 [Streptomyces lydicus]|uniref:hypothetical protein n=1 Tax=Streptomyces lydicus TaxID=47763 RepID=UPI0037A99EFA